MGEVTTSYTGLDKNTYQEIIKISREKKNLSKSEIIKNVETVAQSNGNYTQSEKQLVQNLKDYLTDKNNTIELQSSKIDPLSHKINFSLKLQGEKGIIQKGIETISTGIARLDIPLIRDAKAVAKEEIMSKVTTLGVLPTTILTTGVDLVPDNYLTVIPSVFGFAGKTTKAITSLNKSKLTTSLSSGGKTNQLDFRFINLSYKNENKLEEAYKVIRESTTDVKAISINLRNDKELSNPKQLDKIKKYLFDNKEFQPDPDIAMAWHRLRTGKVTESDKVLLKHETLEIALRESNSNISYQEAHNIANKTYNWQKTN